MKLRTRMIALVMALLMFISTPVSAWATTVDANTYAQWLQDAQTVSDQQQRLITTAQEVQTSTEVTFAGSMTDRPETSISLVQPDEDDADLPQQSISLSIAGTATLHAPGGAQDYQWQVYINGVWANILGDTESSITLTYPMLSNALDGDCALVRCRMEQGNTVSYSAETRVMLDRTVSTTAYSTTQSIPVQATEYTTTRSVNSGIRLLSTNPQQTYLITIQYLFENDMPAANPVIIQIGSSSGANEYNGTVALPKVTGYEVKPPENLPQGVTYDAANKALVFANFSVTENKNINIVYTPGVVEYTVVYFQQNVDGDSNEDYTEKERETREGRTGDAIGEGLAPDAKYDGFRPLIYDAGIPIAADGSTVVNVYYDREYYLITFDLGGGLGVDPIYARFGAKINVGTPTRAGYAFGGWDKEIPSTVPAENLSFTAKWDAQGASFTVVYWLDDPNDNTEDKKTRKYNYWGSTTVENGVKSGDTVNGVDYQYKKFKAVEEALNQNEKTHSEFSHADENVVINGDGSSVVNVYYARINYTLKFYYAMENINTTPKTYHIIGGSTYKFGASGETNTSDAIKLLDYYMDNPGNDRGVVDGIPELNDKGIARKYKQGTDSSSDGIYKYYFISFTAKYGADLTNLWPCDIFKSVTTSTPTSSSNWQNRFEAFCSAWNGEHHVYYSQNNTNQTIKGSYAQLDYKLLWDYSKFKAYANEENTVHYLCFWENGSGQGWNIPELYRYHLWVPVLDGEMDTSGQTIKELNGTTYYLFDVYDTIDNSVPHEQTAPSITGFNCINSDTAKWTKGNNADLNDAWTGKDEGDDNWNWIEIPPEYYEVDKDNNRVATVRYAYDINFYYDRIEYDMEFHNLNQVAKTEKVPYAKNISDTYKEYEPEYPDETQAMNYEFVGWYLDPDCAEGTEYTFADDQATMPAHNLRLYAGWKKVSHNVNVYLTKDKKEKLAGYVVEHGTLVPEDKRPQSDPENGEYNFVHWFYEVENADGTKTEYAFDFNSIPVTRDIDIYAKWSADVVMNYKVYYVKKDTGEEIGDATEFVADLSAGSALAGTTKTFYAKGVTELYENYQTGWFPETQSHAIEISVEEDKNSYTFKYVPADKVPYQVCYVDEEGTELRDTKVYDNNNKAVVTENFVLIPGYVPDALQKRLVVYYDRSQNDETMLENNTITFVYTKDESSAGYMVNHYLVDNHGTVTLHSYNTSTVTMTEEKPATVTVDKLELAGYAFERVECNIADEDNATGFDENTMTVTMEKGSAGFVMNLYYKEKTAQINYKVGSAYQSMGSVSLDSETLGVITGVPKGSKPTANTSYKFVGWYADDACAQPIVLGVAGDGTLTPGRDASGQWVDATYYAKFVLNVADLTITKKVVDGDANDGFSPDENTVFTFLVEISGKPYAGGYTIGGSQYATDSGIITLKAGETASIGDVTIGEPYTVVEQILPAGYTCQNSSASGTISADNNAVTITNTYEVRSLTIAKEVKGADAPKGEYFDFVVALPNGTYAHTTGNVSGELTITNGQAAIRLANGETTVISGVPYGAAYSVTETPHEDYTTEVSGNASGTLLDNANMTFTNTYRYSHLIVEKKGMTQGSAVVRVTVDGVTYTVVLNERNGWKQTIAHLPIGKTISVTEDTSWSWRYRVDTIEQSATIIEGGASVTITNTQKETKWLDDETAVTNAFTGSN